MTKTKSTNKGLINTNKMFQTVEDLYFDFDFQNATKTKPKQNQRNKT